MKVLTVGNSFSQNACWYLTELASAGGHELVIGHADIGSCPFDKHLALAQIHEADPNDPAGKPYGDQWPVMPGMEGLRKSLKEMLAMEEWDIATIQQFSWISDDYSTYQPYAGKLCDYIRNYSPQTEIVIHKTWAYRCDDPRFASGTDSQENMYKNLSDAYQRVASEIGLRVIPVGDAFFEIDTDPVWGYKPTAFNPTNAQYPELPDQTHSLHAGWMWEGDTPDLTMDAHHANPLGCYLAGCLWYEFLFNESAVGNSFVPNEIGESDTRFLQEIAHKVMKEY